MDSRLLNVNITGVSEQPLLIAVSGRDNLSYPYEFKLEVITEERLFDQAKSLLGTAAYFTLTQGEQTQLYHGIIDYVQEWDVSDEGYLTHLYLVPWFKTLTLSRDYRCFVNQSVIDIVKTLFQAYGFTDCDFSQLTQTYPPLPFTVQHHETTFNFISRLLEVHGIYYYFVHTEDKHVMTFCDSGLFSQNPYGQALIYSEGSETAKRFFRWQREISRVPKKITYLGYNFEFSKTPVTLSSAVPGGNSGNTAEQYTHIGTTSADNNVLQQFINLKSKQWALSKIRVRGQSTYLGLYPGVQFELSDHIFKEEVGSYYIYSMSIAAHDHSQRKTSLNGNETLQEYSNTISAYPVTSRFVPLGRYVDDKQIKIKKPIAPATTAVITGPKDQDVYTDSYGRVKLQFHFDRYGKKDENSSNWVRTRQMWAGNGCGTQFIPRIGDEVLVDFYHGDPDQPVVIAGMPNNNNLPPFKTTSQSGFKSHTLGSSNATDGNILRFDDTSGAEEVYIKAQKDLTTTVQGNSIKTVGGNSTTQINKGNYVQIVNGILTVQAQKEIRIACGSSAIIINAGGVTLQADSITMQQGAIPPAQLNPVSNATLAGMNQMLKSKQPTAASAVKPVTKLSTKLAIAIGDIGNLGKTGQAPAMTDLINTMLAKVILNNDATEMYIEVRDGYLLINNFEPGTQQIQLTLIFNGLVLQDQATGSQAAYVIAVNNQTINTANNTIILKPADWMKLAPTKDDQGNTIYQAALSILQPAAVFNFRQALWKDQLSEDEKTTYSAVFNYMEPDDSSGATITDVLPDWHLNMFKANGNNATIFIHGYNVAYGEFASCYTVFEDELKPTQFKSTIYRDDNTLQALYPDAYKPDTFGSGDNKLNALNGTEAHKWFVNMEYNLNTAAGFDGKDYSKYTRLIHVAWQGNPKVATDYMAATTLAKFPAAKVFKLIQQLNAAGIKINLMAHSLGNDVLMHVLELCGQNGISVEHAFMWEPAIPDDSFDTNPRQYLPMNLGASGQALPYDYNYPHAQAGSKAMTVLYSDNDNILGALPQEDQTVNSKITWNAQMMQDFYHGIMVPDHPIESRVGLFIAQLLSTNMLAGPTVYPLLGKLGINGIYSADSDSARIQLLQSKMADPTAGLPLASVAEVLFILDQYGMPHIDQHKKLFSIYHIANIFVYPLSYFFTDGACAQFYTEWTSFYSTFKAPVNGAPQDLPFPATLAQQQQFMRQNLKDAFNFLSLGMYFTRQALTQGLSWSDTAQLITEIAFSNQNLSDWLNSNAPYFEDEISNNIATVLLTGILTDGAMPEAAMGYSGVKYGSEFYAKQGSQYFFSNQKDPATSQELLPDHCGMMIPTQELMDKIYKQVLINDSQRGFNYFGKYKATG